jgi:hypothetical protein
MLRHVRGSGLKPRNNLLNALLGYAICFADFGERALFRPQRDPMSIAV